MYLVMKVILGVYSDGGNHTANMLLHPVLQHGRLLYPLQVRPQQSPDQRAGGHQEEPVHLQVNIPGRIPQYV